MVERMPRGMGSRWGVNWICVGGEGELFEELAGVAVAEDVVGGEVVGCAYMKWVLAVGALPAPLTPLLASQMMPWSRSTRPARSSRARARG